MWVASPLSLQLILSPTVHRLRMHQLCTDFTASGDGCAGGVETLNHPGFEPRHFGL